ncbi:MAG: recombinase family protein, partial [Phycisphaerae bacterium]
YKVDRISRSLIDFAKIMDVLERHDVSFVSVTQQLNTASSMGRLMLNVLLSFAQFEREIISERTRDKIAAARRKGKWSGGHPILGYDVIPGSKLVINTDESQRVRDIFDLYMERQSLIQTAAELNIRGWTTKRWTTKKGRERGGQPFDKTRLFRLLTNPVYRGKVRYKDEVHEGEHDAIIDEDVFQRAQRMLHSNGRAGGMHVRNKYGALLKGLLYCKPCDRPMMHTYTSKGNTRYRYYVCYTTQKQGWDACPSKSVPAAQIERFVVEQIKTIGHDPNIMSMTLEAARAQGLEELASLEHEAEHAEREIVRIDKEIASVAVDATANGHAAARLANLHEEMHKSTERQATMRDPIAQCRQEIITKSEVDAALAEFTQVWECLTPKEQARVMQLLIQRVDYDGANGKVAVTFHASGIRALGRQAINGKAVSPRTTEAEADVCTV